MCLVGPYLNCFPARPAVGLAQVYLLSEWSRADYATFPNLWQDTEADIPVLRQAAAEYLASTSWRAMIGHQESQ
jgi:hypothetical protein